MYTVEQERDMFIGGIATELSKWSLHDLQWWEIHLEALSSTTKEMMRDMDYWIENGFKDQIDSKVAIGRSVEQMRANMNRRSNEISDERMRVFKEIRARPVNDKPEVPPYRMHLAVERKEQKSIETVNCSECGRPRRVVRI